MVPKNIGINNMFILALYLFLDTFSGPLAASTHTECTQALTSYEQKDSAELFLQAVERNDPDGVEFFVELYDIEASQIDQTKALHHAAKSGHTDMAELLIYLGADPDLEATDGQTPYHVALNAGNNETASLIGSQSRKIQVAQSCTSDPNFPQVFSDVNNVQAFYLTLGISVNAALAATSINELIRHGYNDVGLCVTAAGSITGIILFWGVIIMDYIEKTTQTD